MYITGTPNVRYSQSTQLSNGTVNFRTVYCTGIEKRILDCSHSDNINNHNICRREGIYYYASVNCSSSE